MDVWDEMVEDIMHPKPELVASPLVGFRFWSQHSAGRIGPTVHYQQKVWPEDGRMHSSVPSLDHEDAHKHMGIHAYYKPVGGFNTASPRLAGAIVGWGWVCEHESGFRCQHAQVIAFMETENPSLIEAAEFYDVPILPREDLTAYARWWGECRFEEDELGGYEQTNV